jgi:hypothetical protein
LYEEEMPYQDWLAPYFPYGLDMWAEYYASVMKFCEHYYEANHQCAECPLCVPNYRNDLVARLPSEAADWNFELDPETFLCESPAFFCFPEIVAPIIGFDFRQSSENDPLENVDFVDIKSLFDSG